MGRLRTLVTSGVLGALALTAAAAPATAADTKGTLAIVNGIPGTKVDVCLNGREIKSSLPYGGKVFRNDTATGPKNLKFYERDPRRCRGTRLGRKSFTLDPAEDLTIVVTKKAPKVVVFDNVGLGEIPPRGAALLYARAAIRSAADLAAVITYHYWSDVGDAPVIPSAVFLKGQQYTAMTFAPNYAVRMQAAVGLRTVVAPIIHVLASHRYEWMLVGTKAANARFVILDRLVSGVSP